MGTTDLGAEDREGLVKKEREIAVLRILELANYATVMLLKLHKLRHACRPCQLPYVLPERRTDRIER